MGNNVFERLKKSFTSGSPGGLTKAALEDMPAVLSRYMGGHHRKNHPYVSGYWQLILNPPEKIFDSGVQKEATTWWHCTAEGFTPPSRNLNKATVPGQGGVNSNFITGQTLSQTFTVTFREYQNLPIFNLIQLWTSVIDPYTGVSPLEGKEWLPNNYKGSAFIVFTKPTRSETGQSIVAEDLEQVLFFHGVFPEAPPFDLYNTDIATNDIQSNSVTFSFDGWPLTRSDDKVVETAVQLLNDKKYYDQTYDIHFLKSVDSGNGGNASPAVPAGAQ